MEYNKLNKNAKKSWRISNFITLIIVGAIAIGLRIVFNNKLVRYGFVANIVVGIIIFILIINVIVNPIIEYKQWKYMITEDRIEFVHGIYFLTTTIIPMVRIQHIDIEEGPVNRMYKLAKITIHTAGGTHKIEGLPKEKAQKISEYIKDRIQVKVKARLSAEDEGKFIEVSKKEINKNEENNYE